MNVLQKFRNAALALASSRVVRSIGIMTAGTLASLNAIEVSHRLLPNLEPTARMMVSTGVSGVTMAGVVVALVFTLG